MRGLAVTAVVAALAVAGASVAGSGVRGSHGGQPVATHPRVVHAKPVRTKPLRKLPVIAARRVEREAPDKEAMRKRPEPVSSAPQWDGVVQSSTSAATKASNLSTWEGLSGIGTVVPPDPNGEVGATQYLEMVNTSFAVYNKTTGAKEFGPADINTLWQGQGNRCETENDGDPIVVYDQVAQRWLISQFAFAVDGSGSPVGPYWECVAVSTTSDATGSWNIYSFQTSTHLMDDYPKIAVWPDSTNDMYAMTYHTFDDNTGGFWAGGGIMEMNRAQMLAGTAADILIFDVDTDAALVNLGGQLPSDFNGNTLPPDGSPATVVTFDDDAFGYPADQLELYQLTVDWTGMAGALTTMPGSPLPTASFNYSLCASGAYCVPQPGVTANDYLDALNDRLMFRADYQNIGGYEHLVINHTVNATGNATGRSGVRWYDLRKAADASSDWAIYQQSTYAPADTLYRWMGSIALDAIGDIALGYSTSSASSYPGIRYTTRLWSDSLSTLRAESVLFNGSGSQINSYNRWGDYSDMTVDPVDGCTFYYVNEYLPSGKTAFNWRTRIGKFTLPQCPIGATSFTPAYGLADTTVTITGSGFAPGATAVSFHGTDAGDVTVTSPTSLTAVVPVGATSGPITVTSPSGTVDTATDFLVQAAPAPKITGVSPLSGAAGANVTITGTALDNATEVAFGGVSTSVIVSDSATKIVAQVPDDALNGPISVTTPTGTAPSTATFKPLPKITGISGDPVPFYIITAQVTGSNFTSNLTTPVVKLGTYTVTIEPGTLTATSFSIRVPDGAVTGKLTVSNGNATATSPTALRVLPLIDPPTPSPNHGPAGTVVPLLGYTFTGTKKVTVGGAVAPFKIVNYHQLNVTVPPAAGTGTIDVTNAGGTASSGTFTVEPKVTTFTPAAAAGMANVTINGTGLRGATDVTFNGASTPAIVSNIGTRIVAQVPVDATNGPITVHTPGGTATTVGTFKPLPKITGFVDSPAQVGDTVTVNGYDFTSSVAPTVAQVGTISHNVDLPTATSFQIIVLDGAVSGKVTVSNGNGKTTSSTPLLVRPAIDSMSVDHGVTGSLVTLTGHTFTGTSKVIVGGVTAPFKIVNYHELRVTIPATALTGVISVKNAGGTTDSPVFTVDPKITSFTPASGHVGTLVTVTGSGFGLVGDTRVVKVNDGADITPTYVSRTQFRFVVPSGATTGTITIAVNGGTAAVSTKSLTVS